ncbi:MAG: NUDIX domain-containing protein [Tissierellia bacterium]|nr:NUDIX domain-containing protein [Tissierellia bacterium]
MEEISAGGVVIRNDKVCLLKKFRGDWVLPKGRNEEGETMEETALREVLEESGLDAEIERYLGYVKYWYRHHNGKKVLKTVHYYYMSTLKDQMPYPQKEEGFCVAQFMDFNRALRLITHNSEGNMIKNAIRFHNKGTV